MHREQCLQAFFYNTPDATVGALSPIAIVGCVGRVGFRRTPLPIFRASSAVLPTLGVLRPIAIVGCVSLPLRDLRLLTLFPDLP